MTKASRSDVLRKKHRKIIAASKPNCHICGEPISYELKYPDPRSFVVDHVVPIARGGSDALANKKAAHHPRMQQQEESTRVRPDHPPIRRPRQGLSSPWATSPPLAFPAVSGLRRLSHTASWREE